MRRGSLHLNALRAFEAAARHLSFSRAADELHVTHSAISHQVRRLEKILALELFNRTNRGVTLTAAGQTLQPVLADSFDRIGTTLEGLVEPITAETLKVTTTPTFAAKWLIPRLGGWYARENSMAVHLHPALGYLELDGRLADVGLRCGVPPWPGVEAELISPIHLTPLCSRELAERIGLDARPEQLLEHMLIHADIEGHEVGEEWRLWLTGAGAGVPGEMPGLSFQEPNLAFQAAIDGVGIAMGYLELATQDIRDGRLVRLSEIAVRHPFSYYLVYRKDRLSDSALLAFCDWIGGLATQG
ncbi:MAG: LysR family transcriptional regulator [Rhodospirillaceae bacterium]|nr:LysR family transcriptional regulator [Rhodospirillaceae bacterium]MBT6204213.1 LysR family transcriptional regulator [Rhodospirillaceae bacterium]MBT6508895.1 LysR family transcriptional regulator [Rhodospirillaceae bacterium]MBT7614705.1 LysR family transcriptional regulator [Rhodospirillaceae bacterium]